MFVRIFAACALACLVALRLSVSAMAADGAAVSVPIGEYIVEMSHIASAVLVPLYGRRRCRRPHPRTHRLRIASGGAIGSR